MRLGEVLALRWSAVLLDAGLAEVNLAVQPVGGGRVEFGEPKTARSRRSVPLPPRLVTYLRRHRVEHDKLRLTVGSDWQDMDLVFNQGDGAPRSPGGLTRYFARLMDRMGTPEIRFHDLRHAFATNLFHQGVPVKDVSATLGHSSEAFTMRVYQHVLPHVSAHVVGRAVTAIYG